MNWVCSALLTQNGFLHICQVNTVRSYGVYLKKYFTNDMILFVLKICPSLDTIPVLICFVPLTFELIASAILGGTTGDSVMTDVSTFII